MADDTSSPPSSPHQDEHWMRMAIELAKQGQGYVEPNPMVGCVLVRDGKLIGQGYHERFGQAHAEVMALSSCEDPAGSTAYVTLEPCCHQGKTPPCTGALIKAGVSRVVIAHPDPFDQVDGGGIDQLRAAGLEVQTDVLTSDAADVLAPYLKRIRTGHPWVIAKWAMSIDGKISTSTGESQWITGAEARHDVHRVRGCVDAIITGMGTVNSDDPMLTARPAGPRVAQRVILCRNSLPHLDRKIIQTAASFPTMVAVPESLADEAHNTFDATPVSLTILESQPSSTRKSDSTSNEPVPARAEHVVLNCLLNTLAAQGATNVVLEAGGTLMGQFFDANLIDEFHVYLGGKAIGGVDAPGPIGGQGIHKLDLATQLIPVETVPLGRDLKVSYRVIQASQKTLS